jgi:hypothetical protein
MSLNSTEITKAYKLFRVLKDGSITPLFINKKQRLKIGEWMVAENHPTKGYKERPFWHCTAEPHAPHLSYNNRAWFEIEMKNHTEFMRPQNQGGKWYLANEIKIIKRYEVIN